MNREMIGRPDESRNSVTRLMGWLVFRNLAIYNIETLAKSLSNLPKKVQNFAQVAKFRQI